MFESGPASRSFRYISSSTENGAGHVGQVGRHFQSIGGFLAVIDGEGLGA